MIIRTGIKGIKKIKEENKKEWYVFLNGRYNDFYDMHFDTLVTVFTEELDYELADVIGNGLWFTTRNQ